MKSGKEVASRSNYYAENAGIERVQPWWFGRHTLQIQRSKPWLKHIAVTNYH